MTHLQQLVGIALNAQRELQQAQEAIRMSMSPASRCGLVWCVEVHRARLAVCAEHFAGIPAVNDSPFNPEPEVA